MLKIAYLKQPARVRDEEHWLHSYYASFNTRMLKKIGKLADAYCSVLDGHSLKNKEAIQAYIKEVRAEVSSNYELVEENNDRLLDFLSGLESLLGTSVTAHIASKSTWDHHALLKAIDVLKKEMQKASPENYKRGVQLLVELSDVFDALLLAVDEGITSAELHYFQQELKRGRDDLSLIKEWFGEKVLVGFRMLLSAFEQMLNTI